MHQVRVTYIVQLSLAAALNSGLKSCRSDGCLDGRGRRAEWSVGRKGAGLVSGGGSKQIWIIWIGSGVAVRAKADAVTGVGVGRSREGGGV